MAALLGNTDGTFNDVLEPIDREPGSPSPRSQVDVQVVRFIAVFANLRATREEGDRICWRTRAPRSDVPRQGCGVVIRRKLFLHLSGAIGKPTGRREKV